MNRNYQPILSQSKSRRRIFYQSVAFFLPSFKIFFWGVVNFLERKMPIFFKKMLKLLTRVKNFLLEKWGISLTLNDFLCNYSDVGEILLKLYPETAPPIMIIGHSMGGAIAVHIASLELVPSLIGIAVIDVVEGTAMEALASMQSFLRSRPQNFKSIQQAIEWCVRSGQIRNTDSAKVSMPGQIIK